MSIASTRFALKEKRQGKITKNGLTRLTSTPLNPYGSRAKACQPETAISAARQGHGYGSSPRRPASKKGLVVDRLTGFSKRPYKRKKKNFYCLLSIERRGGCPVSATLIACCRHMVMSLPCSKNHPEGLTCLRPTASRAEGGGCQSCQPDFRDFSYPSLFIGKSH